MMVYKNLGKIVYSLKKTPFVIRAMLKILILRIRGLKDLKTSLNLESSEIRLLSDLIVAGFLNTGYRNPKAFGLSPTVDREYELEFVIFKAARIVFEHVMMM